MFSIGVKSIPQVETDLDICVSCKMEHENMLSYMHLDKRVHACSIKCLCLFKELVKKSHILLEKTERIHDR